MTAFSNLSLGSFPNDGTGSTLRVGGALINANMALAANKTEDNTNTGDNTYNGFFSLGDADSVTIAAGVLTVVKSYHSVNGEAGGVDNLDTITGTTLDGTLLVLKKLNASGNITLTESGNIRMTGTTRVLTSQADKITLIRDGVAGLWVEISYNAI